MSKSTGRNYFTKETEKYIVEYNNCTDPEKKQRIFTEHIYFPFYKLAECIIHTFKFYNTDVDQLEDLKCDIVRMLYEDKISKFDPTKGTKAYSYFGTIVKRWLIAYNAKNYSLKKRTVTLDTVSFPDLPEDNFDLEVSPTLSLSGFIDIWVTDMYAHLTDLFPDSSERKVADAILTLFRTRQDLEVFNKKALYVYLKEITGCETVYVTKVVLKLKEFFYKKLTYFQEQGIISNISK